jgi:putative transposase
MPRMARAVVPGVPHHVTQRGDRRESVFLAKADYRRYLNLLREYAGPRGLGIVAYCLMPNHVHLVVLPQEEGSLASVLKPVHTRYAQYMNWVHQMTGRRWQGRFFSCPMDSEHAAAAIRYVETNPVRAGLAERAEEYRWSSAAAHAGMRRDDVLSADAHQYADVEDWLAWLRGQDDNATVAMLRRYTKTGRPLGDEAFVAFMEQQTGRAFKPKRAGRRPGTRQESKQ